MRKSIGWPVAIVQDFRRIFRRLSSLVFCIKVEPTTPFFIHHRKVKSVTEVTTVQGPLFDHLFPFGSTMKYLLQASARNCAVASAREWQKGKILSADEQTLHHFQVPSGSKLLHRKRQQHHHQHQHLFKLIKG